MLDININLLWQLINFLIVLYVLNHFLFKPIGEVLRKRKEEINNIYKTIEEEKAKAEELRKYHDEKIKQIQTEIEEMKRNEIKLAQKQREEIIAEAKKEAQQIIDKGLAKIEIETKKELDKLQDYISDLAIRVAAKILKEEIDPKRHEKLILDYIQKVGEIEWQKR